ncbi:helix-turn-helix domain-containing protein [Haloprofundus halobius]|uniref:helix-turn-helix domain-containing protein n=1 Tax=Haloprofundus halobius TaxID=2876194 RepID=UPI001CCB5A53|nr:bacterio-opsin activator domain-containing protein [Haloprofundus halobius]
MSSGNPSRDIYAETLEIFDRPTHRDEPLTTTEITAELDCSRRAVHKRLKKLVARGELRTKKVGSRGRIWWRSVAVSDGRLFRAVFEEALDAVVLADDDATYVDANPAACDLFGLSRSELLGRTVREFVPVDYDFDRAWRSFQASNTDRGIFPLVRDDGERRLVEFAATPDIVPGRHLSILRDVTDREDYERELSEQRDELRRLDRLNTVIRGVDRAISRAGSRAAVEESVCRQLVATDQYQCAGVGEYVPALSHFEPKAVAGDDRGALEAFVERGTETEFEGTLATDAIETRETQVLGEMAHGPSSVWREILAERGFRSLAVVPLVHRDSVYGILAVVSDQASVFDGDERTLLDELGRTVGHAVNALERERALVDEELLEVTLRSRTLAEPFDGIEDLGPITLDQTIQLDAEVVEYYTVERTTAETLDACCDRLAGSIECDVRILNQSDDVGWVELRTQSPTLATLAASFGGWVETVTVDDGEAVVVVEVSKETNVRRLISALREVAPDIQFLGQERVHRRDDRRRAMRTTYEEALTERQRKTLELAFYAGYFEWPRNTTGEQLADRFSVHPSTLHKHLRRAEAKLLAAFFEGTSTVRET